MFQDDCDHIHFLPLAFTGMASDDADDCNDSGNSLKKKLSRRHNHGTGGNKNALTGRRDLEDILRIKGFSSESESETEASFKLKKKMLHHHRNVTTTPKRLNGFTVTNGGTGDDSGSDSAKDQVTWNSHNCGRSSEAEDDGSNSQGLGDYYPIWQKPVTQNKCVVEQESIYETLYPTDQKKSGSDPPPPPLPPRASKPSIPAQKRPASLVSHRPLERTKALQYTNGSTVQQENAMFTSRTPPEVPRHHKPTAGSATSAVLSQKQVTKNINNQSSSSQEEENLPELPPRPNRLVNPEDAFAFEIIDVDEMRSNSLNNSSHPRACKQFAVDPNNCDNVQQINNSNKKVVVTATASNSVTSDNNNIGGGVTSAIRPIRLAVEDANNLHCGPADVAPLATPEQDSSLIDCSSIENLVDDESSVTQDIIVETCMPSHTNLMCGIETCSEVLNQSISSSSSPSRPLTNSGGDNAQELMSVSSQQEDSGVSIKTEVPTRELEVATKENIDDQDGASAACFGCLLSVPSVDSAGVSPISPCSLITPTSDSGVGNNPTTNSSGSDSNTVVFSNRSSSSDSLASTTNAELLSELPGTSGIVEGEELGAIALPLFKSDIPRPHRPLSRQTTHPPPPAVFLLDTNAMSEELLLSPRAINRPQNRLLSRVASPGPATPLQCPPTPTHHARHNNAVNRAPPPLQLDRELSLDEPPDCDLINDPPPPATFRHLTTTRLPSIPERTYKSQRVELSADDEPLPPCKFVLFLFI
jgi:hypothetical protein